MNLICRDSVSVPEVFPEVSSKRVLCSRLVPGVSIDKVAEMDAAVRDSVGTRLLRWGLMPHQGRAQGRHPASHPDATAGWRAHPGRG